MKLKAVRVFVRDLHEAREFYESKLGFELKADGTKFGYCVFEAGDIELVVESVALDAPEEEQVLVARFTGLSFSVENITQASEKLYRSGVVFTGEPERQVWGGTLATFRDSAGNELQLVQHAAA